MEYNEFIHRLKTTLPQPPNTEELVQQVHTSRPYKQVGIACVVTVAALLALVLLVPQSQSQAKESDGTSLWVAARPASMPSGDTIPWVGAYLHTQQLKAMYNFEKNR